MRQASGSQVPERQHRRQVLQRMQHRARPVRSKEPEGGANVGRRHDPVAVGEEPRVAQGAEGPAQPTTPRPQAPAGVQEPAEGPAWAPGQRYHPVGPASTQNVAPRPGTCQLQEVVLAAAAPGEGLLYCCRGQ